MKALSARLALALMLSGAVLFPAPPACSQGAAADFEVTFDRSTFFGLEGGPLTAGFTLFNSEPNAGQFRLAFAGTDLSITPPNLTLDITAGGTVIANVSVAAPRSGEYHLTAVLSKGTLSSRDTSAVIFLPPVSCAFSSPASNERTGVVGIGQVYAGKVVLTNHGGAAVRPNLSLPARELAGKEGLPPAEMVALAVPELAPGAAAEVSFDGRTPSTMGVRLVAPAADLGGVPLRYGYEMGPVGAFNVTRFEFTLAARELLGVELSTRNFMLGERASFTVYLESRKAGGTLNGRVSVFLRTDIEARGELRDYPAEERFEEFVEHVKSRASWSESFRLAPAQPGVQQSFPMSFHPRMCRASSAGGSFFLDFKGDLDGEASRMTVPVLVSSPVQVEVEGGEKVSYLTTGDVLTRRLTVRNLSNATLSGLKASFFLDFKQGGVLAKEGIADLSEAALPPLAPGEEARVAISAVPLSPGTHVLFPVVSWGELSVYGSGLRLAASAPEGTPVGSYATALLVLLSAALLTRKLSPG